MNPAHGLLKIGGRSRRASTAIPVAGFIDLEIRFLGFAISPMATSRVIGGEFGRLVAQFNHLAKVLGLDITDRSGIAAT